MYESLTGADHSQGVGLKGCVILAARGHSEDGVETETPLKEASGRARRTGAAVRARGGGGAWRPGWAKAAGKAVNAKRKGTHRNIQLNLS